MNITRPTLSLLAVLGLGLAGAASARAENAASDPVGGTAIEFLDTAPKPSTAPAASPSDAGRGSPSGTGRTSPSGGVGGGLPGAVGGAPHSFSVPGVTVQDGKVQIAGMPNYNLDLNRASDYTCDSPPLHHIALSLLGGNGNRLRVDSTPIVCSTGPGTKFERYCQDTMNDPNRRCCPLKPEGHPLRLPCELALLGEDSADGVPGPHWEFTPAPGREGSVEKWEKNPFEAFAYGHGTVFACSNLVHVCGSAVIDIVGH